VLRNRIAEIKAIREKVHADAARRADAKEVRIIGSRGVLLGTPGLTRWPMTRHCASREGRTEVGKHRVRRKCCAGHQRRSAGMHTDWFDSRTAACVFYS
jgi:hypothetical protein